MIKQILIITVSFITSTCLAEDFSDKEKSKLKISKNIIYNVEMQSSFSDNKTPLWLNANKYGLSSLDKNNGYLRANVMRSLKTDSARRWGVGYGLDLAVPYNYTSNVVVQQAFMEGRWLHGVLTIGSKEYPMELKNNRLSSGSQSLGINARPVPQVRISMPEYWALPFTNGWVHFKGHLAYGKMTDDNWQQDFTQKKNKYTEDVLFHSKAGYLKIGNDNMFYPFSIELGLEMASTFGGTAYIPDNNGNMTVVKGKTGLGAFWNAFIPGGADACETTYQNVEGNQIGSWLIRLNWDAETWGMSLYADKYFEDHSSMFQLDYDGYGKGEEWQEKKKHRYLLYDFKDIMLGFEIRNNYGKWLRGLVMEYIYSKYQSGPIYHDHTSTIPDHIGGNDNFYNHYIYNGWQHWGQVMGNPLFRSPVYNTDSKIMVENNRFTALHLGAEGNPFDNFTYRILASWQEGLGTYDNPYEKKIDNVSFLIEGKYEFTNKMLKGWNIKGGYAMDFGKILGNNYGFQLTIAKTGILNNK